MTSKYLSVKLNSGACTSNGSTGSFKKVYLPIQIHHKTHIQRLHIFVIVLLKKLWKFGKYGVISDL